MGTKKERGVGFPVTLGNNPPSMMKLVVWLASISLLGNSWCNVCERSVLYSRHRWPHTPFRMVNYFTLSHNCGEQMRTSTDYKVLTLHCTEGGGDA